ncbi:MAG: hypothetical protein ACRDOE_23525 [Streptosporangiaceae bacterium]
MGNERTQRGLPGEQDLTGALAGALGECDRQACGGQAGQRSDKINSQVVMMMFLIDLPWYARDDNV